jgi:thiamine-monophosphate kinase
MDERELIARFFTGRQAARDDVAVGIGDDAALLRAPPGRELVLATDTMVLGTHFTADEPARSIGHRVLAVNLSDLAAMGATPLWCTLALAIPQVDDRWLADFADGLLGLAERTGIQLVGGDTVRGALAATITVVGAVEPGSAILRNGARPGDGVWVSGTPGDAVAGRLRLDGPADDDVRCLQQRCLFPEPRLGLGRRLVGLASAMLDVSDGLHDDLVKLATASNVALELEVECLPLSAELRRVAPDDAVACALTGGDDYELAFTVSVAREEELARLARNEQLPLTRLGRVVPGLGVAWRHRGVPFDVPAGTFRHFDA